MLFVLQDESMAYNNLLEKCVELLVWTVAAFWSAFWCAQLAAWQSIAPQLLSLQCCVEH